MNRVTRETPLPAPMLGRWVDADDSSSELVIVGGEITCYGALERRIDCLRWVGLSLSGTGKHTFASTSLRWLSWNSISASLDGICPAVDLPGG